MHIDTCSQTEKKANSAYRVTNGVISVIFLLLSRNLAVKYYHDYLNVKACRKWSGMRSQQPFVGTQIIPFHLVWYQPAQKQNCWFWNRVPSTDVYEIESTIMYIYNCTFPSMLQ